MKLTTQELISLLTGLVKEARADLSAEKHHVEAFKQIDKAINALKNGVPDRVSWAQALKPKTSVQELAQMYEKSSIDAIKPAPQPAPQPAPRDSRIPTRPELAFIRSHAEDVALEKQVMSVIDLLTLEILGRELVENPPSQSVIVMKNGNVPFFVGHSGSLINYTNKFITACIHDEHPRFERGFRALDARTLKFDVIRISFSGDMLGVKKEQIKFLTSQGFTLLN